MSFADVALLHAAPTLAMTGVIWLVQVLVYPSFARVGVDAFPWFHAAHVARTSVVVLPLMTVELTFAGWLLAVAPQGALREMATAGIALLGVTWLSTFLVQVPCHAILARGFDTVAHRRLARTNWVRTIAWTSRAALACALLRAS